MGALRLCGRCGAPAQRAVTVVRGRTGQLQQRRRLELADALAADAELGGEAVVGAPGRREGARGEDQPPPFLKLIQILMRLLLNSNGRWPLRGDPPPVDQLWTDPVVAEEWHQGAADLGAPEAARPASPLRDSVFDDYPGKGG